MHVNRDNYVNGNSNKHGTDGNVQTNEIREIFNQFKEKELEFRKDLMKMLEKENIDNQIRRVKFYNRDIPKCVSNIHSSIEAENKRSIRTQQNCEAFDFEPTFNQSYYQGIDRPVTNAVRNRDTKRHQKINSVNFADQLSGQVQQVSTQVDPSNFINDSTYLNPPNTKQNIFTIRSVSREQEGQRLVGAGGKRKKVKQNQLDKDENKKEKFVSIVDQQVQGEQTVNQQNDETRNPQVNEKQVTREENTTSHSNNNMVQIDFQNNTFAIKPASQNNSPEKPPLMSPYQSLQHQNYSPEHVYQSPDADPTVFSSRNPFVRGSPQQLDIDQNQHSDIAKINNIMYNSNIFGGPSNSNNNSFIKNESFINQNDSFLSSQENFIYQNKAYNNTAQSGGQNDNNNINHPNQKGVVVDQKSKRSSEGKDNLSNLKQYATAYGEFYAGPGTGVSINGFETGVNNSYDSQPDETQFNKRAQQHVDSKILQDQSVFESIRIKNENQNIDTSLLPPPRPILSRNIQKNNNIQFDNQNTNHLMRRNYMMSNAQTSKIENQHESPDGPVIKKQELEQVSTLPIQNENEEIVKQKLDIGGGEQKKEKSCRRQKPRLIKEYKSQTLLESSELLSQIVKPETSYQAESSQNGSEGSDSQQNNKGTLEKKQKNKRQNQKDSQEVDEIVNQELNGKESAQNIILEQQEKEKIASQSPEDSKFEKNEKIIELKDLIQENQDIQKMVQSPRENQFASEPENKKIQVKINQKELNPNAEVQEKSKKNKINETEQQIGLNQGETELAKKSIPIKNNNIANQANEERRVVDQQKFDVIKPQSPQIQQEILKNQQINDEERRKMLSNPIKFQLQQFAQIQQNISASPPNKIDSNNNNNSNNNNILKQSPVKDQIRVSKLEKDEIQQKSHSPPDNFAKTFNEKMSFRGNSKQFDILKELREKIAATSKDKGQVTPNQLVINQDEKFWPYQQIPVQIPVYYSRIRKYQNQEILLNDSLNLNENKSRVQQRDHTSTGNRSFNQTNIEFSSLEIPQESQVFFNNAEILENQSYLRSLELGNNVEITQNLVEQRGRAQRPEKETRQTKQNLNQSLINFYNEKLNRNQKQNKRGGIQLSSNTNNSFIQNNECKSINGESSEFNFAQLSFTDERVNRSSSGNRLQLMKELSDQNQQVFVDYVSGNDEKYPNFEKSKAQHLKIETQYDGNQDEYNKSSALDQEQSKFLEQIQQIKNEFKEVDKEKIGEIWKNFENEQRCLSSYLKQREEQFIQKSPQAGADYLFLSNLNQFSNKSPSNNDFLIRNDNQTNDDQTLQYSPSQLSNEIPSVQ